MHGNLSGFARNCHVWLGEVPDWAAVHPVGSVETYLRWNESEAPTPVQQSAAAWGCRIGHGGKGSYGLLGATYEPHDYPFLQISVSATSDLGAQCPDPFNAARVGVSHEFVGGVLAGASQEAGRLGPGSVQFLWGAVHEIDSSWEVFRALSIGVVRLLSRDPSDGIPTDVLPYFGGSLPPAPRPPTLTE